MSEKDDNQHQQQAGNPYQAAYPYYYYPTASPAYYPMYNYRQYAQPQQQFAQQQTQQQTPQAQGQDHGMLPIQESYIENILRLNQGKIATVYMTFEYNNQWNAKVFRGRIEAAGRDHIILSDAETDRRYLLLMVYLDYVTFDEEINYTYPFAEDNQLASYPPR